MIEIIKGNFDREFQKIENDFRHATFLAIDCEFSGLVLKNKLSYFDKIEDRYLLQQKNMEKFIILQVGITAFHFDMSTNTYIPSVYCFYIFPESFGAIDTDFICKTSSIEFLRRYKFDFNKLIYDGIPYLSHEQEKAIKSSLNSKDFLEKLRHCLSMEEESIIQKVCSEISEWLATKNLPEQHSSKDTNLTENLNGEENASSEGFILNGENGHHRDAGPTLEFIRLGKNQAKFNLKDLSPVQTCIFQREISQRFPQVNVYPENNWMWVELKNETSGANSHFAVDPALLGENVVRYLKGFTRIIDLLTELQKPIIAHNAFSDLMMICKQFHGRLPPSYQEYKRIVHALLPVVFDTKFLSYQLRRLLKERFPQQRTWKGTSLEALFVHFQNYKRDSTVFHHPNVLECDVHSDGDCGNGRYHNAGWDSYCAGYIFIQMAHMIATLSKDGRSRSVASVLSSEEHLSAVKQYSNHINVMQNTRKYTVLDGGDPKLNQFNLIVEARNNSKLDIAMVAELCFKYGKAQIRQAGKFRAFLTADRNTCRAILRNLRNHSDIKIVQYSVVRHNVYIRSALWSTLIMSVVGTGYLLLKAVASIKQR